MMHIKNGQRSSDSTYKICIFSTGNSTVTFIQSKMENKNIWTEKFSFIEDQLIQSIDLCETWIDSCQKLTGLFWSNYSPHLWKKKVFIPSYLNNFCKRLNEVC